MKKRFLLGLFVLISAGCGLVMDSEKVSAYDAGDYTVGIMGLGSEVGMEGCAKVGAGHLPCRVFKGRKTNGKVRLVLPAANCDRSSCIGIQLYRRDGGLGPAYSIPKGQGNIDIALSDFVNASEFRDDHDGEYLIGVRIFFKNSDGEHSATGRAFLRLIVLEQGYKQLAIDGPNVAWTDEIKPGCEIQYSTKFRSGLKGNCD